MEDSKEHLINNILDVFNPETKLCILLKNLCKDKDYSKEDFIDYAVEEFGDDYKTPEIAKQMFKRHLEKLESTGLIRTVKNKDEEMLHLEKLSELNGIGLIRIGKIFSNTLLGLSMLTSFILFIFSLVMYVAQELRYGYVIVTACYLAMLLFVYFKNEESFVFK